MQEQIKQLKRENQDLKDLIQDIAGNLVGKEPLNYAMVQHEIIAKIKSIVGGVKFNPLDWDMADKNGEQ